ncbi:MAG: orotidine-5'-phosphate decarboxylase [Campylobacter sp.]
MKLCVALDLGSKKECLLLANELADFADKIWLKVGLRAYLRDGADFIEELKKLGNFKIFLDLKLYDIPNTMADAAEVVSKIGVDMINIHASAGKTAIKTVMNRLNTLPNRPLVLGVSALTSFNEDEFSEIYRQNIDSAVVNFSKMAFESGLDGMVCSAHESRLIKGATSANFITLCPGVRPFGESSNDQKRVADLTLAREAAADFIVVGRPIYKVSNPREICERILEKI